MLINLQIIIASIIEQSPHQYQIHQMTCYRIHHHCFTVFDINLSNNFFSHFSNFGCFIPCFSKFLSFKRTFLGHTPTLLLYTSFLFRVTSNHMSNLFIKINFYVFYFSSILDKLFRGFILRDLKPRVKVELKEVEKAILDLVLG